jgi:hypothetical protein
MKVHHRIDTRLRRPDGGSIDGQFWFHDNHLLFVPNPGRIAAFLVPAFGGILAGVPFIVRSQQRRAELYGRHIDYDELQSVSRAEKGITINAADQQHTFTFPNLDQIAPIIGAISRTTGRALTVATDQSTLTFGPATMTPEAFTLRGISKPRKVSELVAWAFCATLVLAIAGSRVYESISERNEPTCPTPFCLEQPVEP